MNKLLVLFSVFTLSACSPEGLEIAQVEFLCKEHGGMHSINKDIVLVQAYCNDGTRLSANQVSNAIITDESYYAKNESK